jgi:hypothetical protein
MADDDGTLSPLAKFALLAAPTAMLTGFFASYWPFSAWCARTACLRLGRVSNVPARAVASRNLIVPVLFVLLELPVNQAIFVSVMLDIFNCLTITVIYTRSRKVRRLSATALLVHTRACLPDCGGAQVDFRYGVLFGLYVTIIAVTMAMTLRDKLAIFVVVKPEAITNAVTYVPLVIGAQFIVRILIVMRRHRLKVLALRDEKARRLAEGAENNDDHADKYVAHASARHAHAHGWFTHARERRESERATVDSSRRGSIRQGEMSETAAIPGRDRVEDPSTAGHAQGTPAEPSGLARFFVSAVAVEAAQDAAEEAAHHHHHHHAEAGTSAAGGPARARPTVQAGGAKVPLLEAPVDSDNEDNLPEEPLIPVRTDAHLCLH